MKTKIDFFEQYKDPRWQKKRLEIMERDNFRCQSCGDTEKTLNVHHTVPYRKETKPWEYEYDELITLCEGCHKELSLIIEDCKLIIMNSCKTADVAVDYHNLLEEIQYLKCTELQLLREIVIQIKNYGNYVAGKKERERKRNLVKNG